MWLHAHVGDADGGHAAPAFPLHSPAPHRSGVRHHARICWFILFLTPTVCFSLLKNVGFSCFSLQLRGCTQMSVTLMVATLLQRFRFTPLHPMDVDYDITLNFQKTGGLHMQLEPRNASNPGNPVEQTTPRADAVFASQPASRARAMSEVA
jgi:hypothetical protein